jgi:hypothetical protein
MKVFWSDEVHQLHDTDVKSFIPALEGAMNFIGRFSPMVKDNIAACISTGQQCDFEAVLITTKKKKYGARAIGNAEFINGMQTNLRKFSRYKRT